MKKSLALLLALALIFAFPVSASAAETTEARVPVTLTVVNTVSPISCTVPAALPVSLVDGYVVCANNAAITNTGKTGAIKVTKVDVQAGTFEIGSYDDFSAGKNSIALSINGCSTKGAGALTVFFGGAGADGLAAAVFALALCLLQMYLPLICKNKVLFNFLAAFCVGSLISLACRALPALHGDKIIIGDIMLLIPGLAFTNAVKDIFIGDTISGVMRLIETILWAAALALGFALSGWLLGV
jgi:uncharacterized membrane protein YjjB (DUF3815 family)